MNMMKEELTATKQTLEKIKDGKFFGKMETEIRKIAKEEAEGTQAPQIEETVRQIVQNENEGSPNHSGEKGDAKEQLAEIKDRLRRKTNLVIFKLPEAEKQEEQTKKDNSKATEILELLKMDPRPKDIRRLGKPSTGKIRPLRLSFSSEGKRDEVLKAFHKARKAEATNDNKTTISKIAVRKDLTPKERAEEEASYNLYKELKQKREESKKAEDEWAHWVRRNGEVINISKQPAEETDKDN